MIYVGIDPGKSGAVVALDAVGGLVGCWDQPVIVESKPAKNRTGKSIRHHFDVAGMVNIMRAIHSPYSVALEWPGTRPGEGAVGALSLGDARSLWRGILVGRMVPTVLVHPNTWQIVLQGQPGAEPKARAVLAAMGRWPDLELARKQDHDRAQAAWIAEWHRRLSVGAK